MLSLLCHSGFLGMEKNVITMQNFYHSPWEMVFRHIKTAPLKNCQPLQDFSVVNNYNKTNALFLSTKEMGFSGHIKVPLAQMKRTFLQNTSDVCTKYKGSFTKNVPIKESHNENKALYNCTQSYPVERKILQFSFSCAGME